MQPLAGNRCAAWVAVCLTLALIPAAQAQIETVPQPIPTQADKQPETLEEKLLLPLLLQERALLQDYGQDYPEVRAVRARIAVVREFLAHQPVPRPEAPPAPVRAPTIAFPPSPINGMQRDAWAPQLCHAWSVIRSFLAARAAEASHPIAVAVAAKAPPPTALPVKVAPAAPTESRQTDVLLQLIGILAALAVILLVQIVALLVVLRRYANRPAAPLRLEVVQHPTREAAHDVQVHRLRFDAPEPMERRRGAGALVEELYAPAEAKEPHEEAVLRQVFEDNVRMHAQIDALEGTA